MSNAIAIYLLMMAITGAMIWLSSLAQTRTLKVAALCVALYGLFAAVDCYKLGI